MKASILVAAIAACALSTPIVSAQEKSAPARPAMSMDMDKQMPQMQENMKTMQGQMDKIRRTTDPKERRKLLQEHMQAMQAMQAGMNMMQSVGGPMMMRMLGDKPGTSDPKQQQEMMAWRMDMMQMMMEQMLQHDQAQESRPTK